MSHSFKRFFTLFLAGLALSFITVKSSYARPCDPLLVRWNDEEMAAEHQSGGEKKRADRCAGYYLQETSTPRERFSPQRNEGLISSFLRYWRGDRNNQRASQVQGDENEPLQGAKPIHNVVAVDCSESQNRNACGCVRDADHPDCEDIRCGDPQ
ncbi:MAG: hypothetical protein Q7S98_01255 [Deltaproteobacteria bacterium]|nr:hypothetical protein [Deltaproteobacteria bacterium]